MSNFYIRYTLPDGTTLYSDTFFSRESAYEYADNIKNIDVNQNSKIEVFKQGENMLTNYGYEENDDEIIELKFSEMTYQKYGKGFLLKPPANHPDYGTKYYYNGWWMPSQNAWFFKSKFFSTIIDNGATLSPKFSGMTYSKYGKGYLLSCKNNHPDYGTKYYNNGWWMPTQNAWFFKSKYKSYLKNNGASRVSN